MHFSKLKVALVCAATTIASVAGLSVGAMPAGAGGPVVVPVGGTVPETLLVTTTEDLNTESTGVSCPAVPDETECTLRKAVEVANGDGPGHTIVVPPGTYVLEGSLSFDTDMTVVSQSGDPKGTIISSVEGNSTNGDGWNITIQGVTLTGADNGSQPAIYSGFDDTLTLRDVIVTGNHSTNGVGAGVGAVTNSTLIIDSSTISDNHIAGSPDGYGGGVWAFSGATLLVSNSTFAGNTATDAQPPALVNASASGESAGGAIGYETGVDISIVNTTVSGNEADSTGGGIAEIDVPKFTRASSTGGSSSAQPAPGWPKGPSAQAADPKASSKGAKASAVTAKDFQSGITNSIVAGNTPDNCGSVLSNPMITEAASAKELTGAVSNGGNLEDDSTRTCGFTDAKDVIGDPKLGPLQDNGGPTPTMSIPFDSPAANHALNDVCSQSPVNGLDQRGEPRPGTHNPVCDIGAFESQDAVPNVERPGYWTAAGDGGVFSYGSAGNHFHGSLASTTLNAPVVGIAVRPDGDGYWLAGQDGAVYAFGSAINHFRGSLGGQRLNSPIVGIAGAPDGDGYYLVAADGGVFAFGSAAKHFHGSMGGKPLNKPIVGIDTVTDGDGYWLVASDGGIFAFGSAARQYYGSMGGKPLNKPVVGIAASPDGEGYWMVASDGGIFSFGSAAQHYYGSMGGRQLNSPMVGMASMPDGDGYFTVAADGGVFSYGTAASHFTGSMGGKKLNAPMTSIAVTG
jgi:hypothetical protein